MAKGRDPPDVYVAFEDREVSVELTTVVDEKWARQEAEEEKRWLTKGELPPPKAWENRILPLVMERVKAKTSLYARRGSPPNWLVLHGSLRRPGYSLCGLEGHRWLRSQYERQFRATPFEAIILQTHEQGDCRSAIYKRP